MANLNLLQLISLLKCKNPEEVVKQLFKDNFSSNPALKELIQMAENGDNNGVQQFAQNYFSGRGIDFDTELSNFMQLMRNNL